MSEVFTGGATGDTPSSDASIPEMASATVQSIKHEIDEAAEDFKRAAADQIDHQREAANHTLSDFAAAIRSAGEDLSRQDQSFAAQIVRQAADSLEGFSRAVTDKRPEEMLSALRDFGRESPIAFAAGSALVGMALGRFLRSSEPAPPSRRSASPAGDPVPLATGQAPAGPDIEIDSPQASPNVVVPSDGDAVEVGNGGFASSSGWRG